MITKYFTTKHVFLAIFAILLLSIAFQFFSLLSFPDSSIVLVKGDTVKLQPEDSLTQKFTANRDGLNKVEFLLRTPGIVFENKDVMKVQLLDENCQKPLREGVLKESFLNSGNLYEFPFSKVENSQNKIFCVIATFQPTKSSAKAIQFFTSDGPPRVDERLSPRVEAGAQLSIRPVYVNDNVWQNLSELNQRISQYKPFFLRHIYLATFSILFIVLSIVLVMILILT